MHFSERCPQRRPWGGLIGSPDPVGPVMVVGSMCRWGASLGGLAECPWSSGRRRPDRGRTTAEGIEQRSTSRSQPALPDRIGDGEGSRTGWVWPYRYLVHHRRGEKSNATSINTRVHWSALRTSGWSLLRTQSTIPQPSDPGSVSRETPACSGWEKCRAGLAVESGAGARTAVLVCSTQRIVTPTPGTSRSR
ncbi:hypothetical protein RhoFasGS6_02481 [Rhodococcus fascians]|nr:hypothetical protein [Rhodococcus fascians]